MFTCNEKKTGAELAKELSEEMKDLLVKYKGFMRASIGDFDELSSTEGAMVGMMNEMFKVTESSLELVQVQAAEITEINGKLDKVLEQKK